MFYTLESFNKTPYQIPAKQLATDDGTDFDPTFEDYADDKEEQILKKILGIKLYNQFMAALELDYPAEKWIKLRDGAEYEYCGITYEWKGLEKLEAPFIFAQWLRDNYDTYSDTGISVPKTENAEMLSPALRIVQAHNDFWRMQGNCRNKKHSLYGFLEANESDYPDWVFEDIGSMNRFNL